MSKSLTTMRYLLSCAVVTGAGVLATGPAIADTGNNWNIRITGGCPVGALTLGVLPGWDIQETTGNTPPARLQFHEQLIETYTSNVPGIIGFLEAEAAIPYLLSPYFATQAWASFTFLTFSDRETGVTVPVMNPPQFIGPYKNPNNTYSFRILLTRDNIFVDNLRANGIAGWTYFPASLVPPNIRGLTLEAAWTLTALPGSGGNNALDDTGVMMNTIGLGKCRG
ncbi:MAG: hypothetical protein LBQ32_04040 [Burkholderiaceae bacterium]|jgi:hypothetical protein|nr:hypothetical protein [Burkholderiaceae bacterium]